MSPRLHAVDPDTATDDTADLFEDVRQIFGGWVPNLMRTFANSPAALRAWLNLYHALEDTFTPQVRQQIAVAVAQANTCPYCLSANIAAGRAVGVSDTDLDQARDGKATDAKTQALVELARTVVTQRGLLDDVQIGAARAAGWDDKEIVEVIALVAMNTMMNYTNSASDTDIDWPTVTIDRQHG